MATTLQLIETALSTLWAGTSVVTLAEGAKTVPTFVDYPDAETTLNAYGTADRVIPSISVLFLGMSPDEERYDSESYYEVGVEEAEVPYVITERKVAVPYRVRFQVNTWARDAAADRALMMVIERKTEPRGVLVVGSETLWMFRSNVVTLDEKDSDRVVYHKAWTLEVLAEIENSDTDEQGLATHEIQLSTTLVKTQNVQVFAGRARDQVLENGLPGRLSERFKSRPVDTNGEPVAAGDAVHYPDRTISITDAGFTVLP